MHTEIISVVGMKASALIMYVTLLQALVPSLRERKGCL